MRVVPAERFYGRFTLPGDKSVSHRAALLAALAEGTSRIGNFTTAADGASTLRCLSDLGVAIERDGPTARVRGRGPGGLRPAPAPLDAGNSGSTLRMLAGILAGRPFRSVLTGDESLRRRPVERVAAPLRAMGARLLSTDGRPPLTVEGTALHGIDWLLPVPSAQVKTAVLLAGLQARGRTRVEEAAPSRDHTERMLPVFGVPVRRDGLATSVEGPATVRAADVDVPGDPSSAAFLVVAALVVPDAHVRIDGVLLNPTRIAFLDVLREMGGDVSVEASMSGPEPVGSIEARSSSLRGVAVDPRLVPALIDEVPALAVAACHAVGTFTVTGAAELRVKESDRVAALAEGLARLGARIEERPDGLSIRGGTRLRGAAVRSHGDHRIAMALAVAGLAAEGETEVEGAECIGVSFPEFPSLLAEATAGRA